jgi:hypothetical protein
MLKKYEAQKKLNTFWHILCSTFCDLRVRAFSEVIVSTPAHAAVFNCNKSGSCNYGCRPYSLHKFWEVAGNAASSTASFTYPQRINKTALKVMGMERPEKWAGIINPFQWELSI